MNAGEVIQSYVRDVASCLPRSRRDDVAFELRALLTDELAAKAEAQGRAPDTKMAMELLKGFGRPPEVARRYHERPALIDPADTHHFLIWSIAGTVALSVLSALSRKASLEAGLFLEWLGLLLVVFALIAWWRRAHPNSFGWRPKRGPDFMPRWLAVFALAMTLIFPLSMYAAPEMFVETLFVGSIPTSGLELTEAFRQSWQRAATLALLLTVVALYAATAVQGGWRSWTRWAIAAAHLALGLLLVAHARPMSRLPGEEAFAVFASPTANAAAMPIFGAVGALLVLGGLYDAWRAWSQIRPAPAVQPAG